MSPKYVWYRVNGVPRRFEMVGRGTYPYECIAKDRFPRAAIYAADGGWFGNYSQEFNSRLKAYDDLAIIGEPVAGIEYAVRDSVTGEYVGQYGARVLHNPLIFQTRLMAELCLFRPTDRVVELPKNRVPLSIYA